MSSGVMRRFLRVFSSAFLAVLFGGCGVSIPRPDYYKVDKEAPAFKEAVVREKERQQEKGKSAAKAEAIAVQKVTRQIIKTEAQQRAEEVAPLAQALQAFERSRGCWAYTFTTTQRIDRKTTVEVARYDAFQPEERLWTLVTRDGQTPDEKAQADYRRKQLRAWKKAVDKASGRNAHKNSQEARMWNFVSGADLELSPPDSAGRTTYQFARAHGHFPLVGDIPAARMTYTTESSQNSLVNQTEIFLEPWSMLGGSIKLDVWESSADYILIEPTLPPFPARTKMRYRGHIFGKDTGDVEVEVVYTDYRRVKCYDERFEVKIGAPSAMDIVPAQP
jgi:hypothetical protein